MIFHKNTHKESISKALYLLYASNSKHIKRAPTKEATNHFACLAKSRKDQMQRNERTKETMKEGKGKHNKLKNPTGNTIFALTNLIKAHEQNHNFSFRNSSKYINYFGEQMIKFIFGALIN